MIGARDARPSRRESNGKAAIRVSPNRVTCRSSAERKRDALSLYNGWTLARPWKSPMARIPPTPVPRLPALVRRSAMAAAVGMGLGGSGCGGDVANRVEEFSGTRTNASSTSSTSSTSSSAQAESDQGVWALPALDAGWLDAGWIDAASNGTGASGLDASAGAADADSTGADSGDAQAGSGPAPPLPPPFPPPLPPPPLPSR